MDLPRDDKIETKIPDNIDELGPLEPFETITPAFTNNPYYCVQECSGFCCSEYTVLITIQDVKRIIDHIPGIHPYQFMTFYDESVETLNYYPIIKIQGHGYVIGMIQDEKRKTCPFHTALGLCGIHDFSPMVCQTYPFSLTDDLELTYISNPKCGKLFPPLDKERIKKIILQSWREIDEYKELVRRWNEKHSDDSFDEFMVFAGALPESYLEDKKKNSE
ncbi:MAG: YkgJ family cysteine cluster protein [Promethearchaeota archaeon]